MGLGTRESMPLSLSLSQGEPGIAGFKGEPGPKGEPVSICCGVPGNIPMPGWTQVGQPQLTHWTFPTTVPMGATAALPCPHPQMVQP